MIGLEAGDNASVGGWVPTTSSITSSLSDFNTNPYARSLRDQHVLSVDMFSRDQVGLIMR